MAERGFQARWRRVRVSLAGSVRIRSTVAAVVVVGLALSLGGLVLVLAVNRSLRGGLVTTDRAQVDAVSVLAAQGRLPAQLAVRAGVAVQVVDGRGRVVSSTADLVGRGPVTDARPPPGHQEVLRTSPVFRYDDDPDLTVAATVHGPARRGAARRGPSGPLTIYAVTSVEPTENSTHVLALTLAAALPLFLVVVGSLVWAQAGRALRPVESIRSEVAAITAAGLDRRVPEPPLDDEIGRLARTMNAMLGRLQAGAQRQRQFVADASHELRSPLAALVAQVDVARAHPGTTDWPAVADAVAEEGARLSRLVDDLLLLARSDEGHLAPGHDPADLDELVLAEAARLRAVGQVRVDAAGVGAGRVPGDPDQLRRLVRNLADNAARHARSTVTFAVDHRGDEVELVVADDGPGIPVDRRQRVFERFARLDTARDRSAGGTGLGLAIVGEIVAVHGGTVAVGDSAVGARLVVRLPAWPAR